MLSRHQAAVLWRAVSLARFGSLVGCSSDGGAAESSEFVRVRLKTERRSYDETLYSDACTAHFNTESLCNQVEGCSWTAGTFCDGYPRPCRQYSASECSEQLGCTWYSPPRCSDEESCNLVMYVEDQGCSDVPAYCVGTYSGNVYIDLAEICRGDTSWPPQDSTWTGLTASVVEPRSAFSHPSTAPTSCAGTRSTQPRLPVGCWPAPFPFPFAGLGDRRLARLDFRDRHDLDLPAEASGVRANASLEFRWGTCHAPSGAQQLFDDVRKSRTRCSNVAAGADSAPLEHLPPASILVWRCKSRTNLHAPERRLPPQRWGAGKFSRGNLPVSARLSAAGLPRLRGRTGETER